MAKVEARDMSGDLGLQAWADGNGDGRNRTADKGLMRPLLWPSELHRRETAIARAGRGRAWMIAGYDGVMATAWDRVRDKERDRSLDVTCERCDRQFDPAEVQTCGICKKPFCRGCSYRIGSADYCSRGCGDAYFFGGVDDGDPED